jgi:hypothetical protein
MTARPPARRPGGAPARSPLQGRVLPAVPNLMDLDLEYLEDTRYVLPGRLKKMVLHGEVAQCGPMEVTGNGTVGVWVRRLKPPTPWWKRAVPYVVGGLAVLAVVGWVLYLILPTVLMIVGVVVGGVVVVAIASALSGGSSYSQVMNIGK